MEICKTLHLNDVIVGSIIWALNGRILEGCRTPSDVVVVYTCLCLYTVVTEKLVMASSYGADW